MREKINSDIIRKYINGTYTYQELKKLANWFNNEKFDEDIREAVYSHWDKYTETESMQERDLSSVLKTLKTKILPENKSQSFKQRVITFYFRVAAILLIPLLIYSSYTLFNRAPEKQSFSKWIEIVSPYGSRTHFDLPDGTKVSLNSGAHLKYNADFNNERKISIEGEAYFDVHHDASSPFIVEAEMVNVKVLGTKFSVSSFLDENTIDVILEEGKVQLFGENNSLSEVLKPDEKFSFDKNNMSGEIEHIDAKYAHSWKDGILIFRNEPLGEVIRKIGHWYNVKFDVLDPELTEFRYRATFQNEPLEEVLRLISLTSPIEYVIKERKVNEKGQYENKVIELRIKK
ncbi:FecR family protein [Sunxiuqinia sp. A32]|uniref:FecR family protein n=1 Tax=Sunxiuqinia sp. A32 TaxID=3461496 RepID=UPI0040455081